MGPYLKRMEAELLLALGFLDFGVFVINRPITAHNISLFRMYLTPSLNVT